MKCKKATYLVFFAAIQLLSGQYEQKRADMYFEKAFYSDAIGLYETILAKRENTDVMANLADCHYHTTNMQAAARWYGTLLKKQGSLPQKIHYHRYYHALKAIGDYKKAHAILQEYHRGQNNLAALQKLQNDSTYIANVRAMGDRFTIENLSLNTTTSEFAAVAIGADLIYTAARKQTQNEKIYPWNNQKYLDLYSHPLEKITLPDSVSIPFSKNINTKMHEGTFAITKDGKTLYFTRNNFKNGKRKTNGEKISTLKIYRAELKNGAWRNSIELPFNSNEFSNEHPSLNAAGNKLYFSSDRPGGYGGFDLYWVTVRPDGTFGNPTNMGPMINTAYKEQFPHLDQANNLYFASDGHPGFGSLDIFVAKYDNGNFQQPDNLGLPVNGGYDDFSFSLETGKKTGFFASNRPSGKGSDDIYRFAETKPLVIEDCKQYIVGTLTDSITKAPLPNARIHLMDGSGNIIKELMTGTTASYAFDVSCKATYRIVAKKEAFEDNALSIRTDDERQRQHDGSLRLYSLKEKAIQQERDRLKKQQELVEKQENEKIEAKKKRQEQLKTTLEDAIARGEFYVKNGDTYIRTEEIHFDYSLWYLRRETRERLKKVVQVMKKYPSMVVEIGTHTDIRGDAAYNRDLSQKRADAVRDFFLENGIEENRAVAKGYGESKPIVPCKDEESCSEEDHEWNRRCEFKVLKWE